MRDEYGARKKRSDDLENLLLAEQKRVSLLIVDDKPQRKAMLEASTSAVAHAIDLIHDGVVGEPYDDAAFEGYLSTNGKRIAKRPAISGCTFHVDLSGHANPGHNPRDGWANDTLAIRITQVTPQETATDGKP